MERIGSSRPSEIGRQTQQLQLSNEHLPESTRKKKLMLALATCFLDRGETMDDLRLESYSKALLEVFNSDIDTMTVLERLANRKRGEYESAILPKADLIDMIRYEDVKRREEKQKRIALDELARWEAEADPTVTMKSLMEEAERRIAARKGASA